MFSRNSALHVSLSSYSLVKEPISNPRGNDITPHAPTRHMDALGCSPSEKCTFVRFPWMLQERAIWSPAARRPRCGGYIGPAPPDCQHRKIENVNFLCRLPLPPTATSPNALLTTHLSPRQDSVSAFSGCLRQAALSRCGPIRSGQCRRAQTTKTAHYSGTGNDRPRQAHRNGFAGRSAAA